MVPIATSVVNSTFRDNGQNTIAAILKIVLILGMSTVPAGATAFIAQMVSQGAGQNESNDLMHAQQMLGNGMRLAGLAAGKALSGGLAALAGGGGGISSAMRGGAGGAASGLTPTRSVGVSPSGGSPLGQTPTPLSGGGSNGGAGGNLGAAAMQSASSLGLSPMGGSGGGAGTHGGGFGGASGSGGAGSPGGSFAGGESPSPMGGPSFAPGGGAMQGQSSAAGAAGSGLALGAANPEMFAGAMDSAAQQTGSSAPQEGLKEMFLRDQRNSGLKHQGGIHSAIFRGGVIGAVGYGLMRLAGRGLTAAWSGAKWVAGKIKNGVGKLPARQGFGGLSFGGLVGRRDGTKTLNDRWAEKRQEKDAKRQLEQDAKMAKHNAEQQQRSERLNRSQTHDLFNAQEKDAKQNWKRKGNEPMTNNNERHYIDKQLDAFQKEKKGVDKTLSEGDNRFLSNEQKAAYRQKMLGGSIEKLQRTLGASQYGRSDAVQNRFKNILGGAQQEGGEQ